MHHLRYTVNGLGYLERNGKLQVKKSERRNVFEMCHGKCHSGREKTWYKIRERFFWVGGEAYVRQAIKDCVNCRTNKTGQHFLEASLPPLKAIKVIPQPMYRIHVDLLGPFPESLLGNKYIAVAVCAFTKYPEAMGNIT